MKKIAIIMIALLSLSACGKACELDGNSVCYDDKDQIMIEEQASIKIAIDNEVYGEQIVTAWNEQYPEYVGLLSYEIKSETDIMEILKAGGSFEADIIYMNDIYVASYLTQAYQFDEETTFDYDILDAYASSVNKKAKYYVPMSVEGMLYAYNETKSQELGIDLSSYQSIEAMEAIDYENLYFYTNHVYLFYPFLRNRVFEPLSDGKSFGFEQEAFVEVTQRMMDIKTKLHLKDDQEAFDNFFFDGNYLSGFIGSWMQYEEAEATYDMKLVFQKMPTYLEEQLQPIASSKGFVMNRNTTNPSAAHAVLSFLRSKQGIQTWINYHPEIPLIKEEQINDFEYLNDHQKEKSIAYNYSTPFLPYVHPEKTGELAFQFFTTAEVHSVMEEWMNGNLSAIELQTKFQEAKDIWIHGTVEEKIETEE